MKRINPPPQELAGQRVSRYLVEVNECVPQWVLGQNPRISDDDAPEASSRQGDIEAPRIGKEADALVLVRSGRQRSVNIEAEVRFWSNGGKHWFAC